VTDPLAPATRPASLDVPVGAVDPPDAAAPRQGTPRGIPVVRIAIALVAVLAGGALFMSGYTMGRQTGVEPGTPVSEDDRFRPFWDTYHTITDRYAGGELDRDALVQGAIRGMIEELEDPYSSYLTAEEYRQSLQDIGGQFEGIGAEIATEAPDGSQGCGTLGPDCALVIVAPIVGSPAEKVGLQPGDRILAVDGSTLDGLTVDGALERIRGPRDTVVTLTLQRTGSEPFELPITRAVIEQQEIETRVLADGAVGYVRLNGFSDRGADELEEALGDHRQAGRTRLILDLRGNPGGYITAARDVASQFIGSGPIFWEEEAGGRQTPTDAVPGGAATDEALEIVCLVDRGSASASEIVAGALQDTGRATIVGETTFGKGTVQQWQELTGEGGAFRLTVARWLTPDKRWVHDVGIVPDVEVELPATIEAGQDPVLDRALELLGGEAGLRWTRHRG
jgi:carboxyl-terminal processing protease